MSSRFLPSTIVAAFVSVFFLLPALSAFGQAGWVTDMDEAMAQAKEEGKDIFLNFTGSDWCHWCLKLNKEVFKQDSFAPVKDSFVLVSLDFPQDRSKLTKAQLEHNEKWRSAFEVGGFPAAFLLDAAGRPFARTGYREGGPEKYLEHLVELQSLRKKRDSALTLAKATQGLERAKHIDSAISILDPQIIFQSYIPLVEEITRLDAENELGLKAKYEEGVQRRTIGKEMGKIMAGFNPSKAASVAKQLVALEAKVKPTGRVREDLRAMMAQMLIQGKEFDKANSLADEMISEEGRQEASKLNWRTIKVNALASQKDFAGALAELDEMGKSPAATGDRAAALIGLRAQVLVGDGRDAEAVKLLDDLLATIPESELKGQIKILREGIQKRVDSKEEAELPEE